MAKPKKLKAVRKRSRDGTSALLLDTGLKLFARHGYDAVSTRDIAREADVNESLIHRYFQGKAGFLKAVVRHFKERYKDVHYSSYPAGDTPEEELTNYFEARLDYHILERDFLRLVILRAIVDPDMHASLKSSDRHGATLLLADRLAAFQARGLIRAEVDPAQAATMAGQVSFSRDLMAHIVMRGPKKQTLKDYARFARDYAKGLCGPQA
jgi:AcrR family transcriptional regulator